MKTKLHYASVLLLVVFLAQTLNLSAVSKPDYGIRLSPDYKAMFASPLVKSPLLQDVDYQYPLWGYYVLVSPGLSRVVNNKLAAEWEQSGKIGFNAEFGYFKAINSKLKYKVGLGINTFGSEITIGEEIPDFEMKDIDSVPYLETLELSSVSESVGIMALSVPLRLEFGNPNVDKIGYYINAGARISYLLNVNYSSTGTYTTEGFYDMYNVRLYGIEELGFYKDKSLVKKESGFGSFNVSLIAAAGISIPVSRAMIVKLGVNTDFGLSNLSQSPVSSGDFNTRMNYVSEYSSLTVPPSSKANSRFVGFEVGLYLNRLLY